MKRQSQGANATRLGAKLLTLSGGKLNSAQLRAILDVLPNNVALLDPMGELMLVNEAWLNFAVENGMTRREAASGNYLNVCRSAASTGDVIAKKTAQGIEKVLKGRIKSFILDYPCDSLTEKRWFRMHVLPVQCWGERCCLVSHADITPRR
ncbi:MAG: hypothetical protein RJB38_1554 [Pseudomonadota bacterium]